MLSGKASYGSRTPGISVFIGALSPDVYMQFLVLVKTVLGEEKQNKKEHLHITLGKAFWKIILQAASLLLSHNNAAILLTSRKSLPKVVSQCIQKLTWKKPFLMRFAAECRVEIFKRNILSRYYSKEQTQFCDEYSAGYLRDHDQDLVLHTKSQGVMVTPKKCKFLQLCEHHFGVSSMLKQCSFTPTWCKFVFMSCNWSVTIHHNGADLSLF